MQEKIKYSDIMALGFEEEEYSDMVFFKEFGYAPSIVTLNLTKKIYIDWDKPTQLCEIVRIDNTDTCDIMKRMPIKDLSHLREMVDFFSDKKVAAFNPMTMAC